MISLRDASEHQNKSLEMGEKSKIFSHRFVYYGVLMENIIDKNEITKCAVVAINSRYDDESEVEASLDELERLIDTAGGECSVRLIQNKSTPDVKTYIGSGKVKELSDLCEKNSVSLVIVDSELSPSQIKNLEDEIEPEVRVIDRSMLILDIFALHATSGEGKLQVELAQLKYTIPRLSGKGNELSRLGGGIGTRGPGESKLETDRRHLLRRIHNLEEQLSLLDKNRAVKRKSRQQSSIPKIAIAGYTNAGKSTLLNYLTGAGILAEDKLFATLDPTTRKFILPDGTNILLTDTVGFIRNLPHHLIRAFRSTLEEVVYADAIMILIDTSDEHCDEQLEVTQKLIYDLGAGDKPILYVYNKCDIAHKGFLGASSRISPDDVVYISAKTGIGIDNLLSKLQRICNRGKSKEIFIFPNNDQSMVGILYKYATVHEVRYGDKGIMVCATVDDKTRGMLKKYLEKKDEKSEY